MITFGLFAKGVQKHMRLGKPLFSPQGQKTPQMAAKDMEEV